MWNQCAYRECVYGPSPWITLDGSLTVTDVSVSCPQGEATPLNFTIGEVIPCETSTAYCAGV